MTLHRVCLRLWAILMASHFKQMRHAALRSACIEEAGRKYKPATKLSSMFAEMDDTDHVMNSSRVVPNGS